MNLHTEASQNTYRSKIIPFTRPGKFVRTRESPWMTVLPVALATKFFPFISHDAVIVKRKIIQNCIEFFCSDLITNRPSTEHGGRTWYRANLDMYHQTIIILCCLCCEMCMTWLKYIFFSASTYRSSNAHSERALKSAGLGRGLAFSWCEVRGGRLRT